MSYVELLPDGTYQPTGVVVLSCGCGGIGAEINRTLLNAGVDPRSITIITTTSNLNAKKFIRQSGLDQAERSLRTGKYAVLYNPDNKKFINILHTNKDKQILSNIYKVVNGT